MGTLSAPHPALDSLRRESGGDVPAFDPYKFTFAVFAFYELKD
jgi:hypothetical protein